MHTFCRDVASISKTYLAQEAPPHGNFCTNLPSVRSHLLHILHVLNLNWQGKEMVAQSFSSFFS
jgi:hypothetical protein